MATREEIYTAIRNADKAGDTASVQKLAAYLSTMDAPAEAKPAPSGEKAKSRGLVESFVDDVSKTPERVGNVVAGAVRGAGSIGATLTDIARRKLAQPTLDAVPAGMRPDVTAGLANAPSSRQMRSGMDEALQGMGADPNSLQYGVGKIGAEVAGTLGVGGGLASLLRGAPGLANAVASGGFVGPQGTGQLVNWLTRIAGGATNGAATAGLVDPNNAAAGAAIGGALPVVTGVSGAVGDAVSRRMESGARRLMQSAIKPTIKQLQTGDANTAVNTLLERGINPNEAGVNRLRELIEGVDNQIGARIANSTATVDKGNVLNRILQTERQFANQVAPTADLAAIRGVGDDFLAHPNFPLPQTSIPVQAAQDLKRGTYQVLSKKYGQMGGAETEAQKALARGLKEEIATAVPGVQGLNEELSRLVTTLNVTERRALMEMNKNPTGLATLASSPGAFAAFMADRSALFKSLAARMINSSAGGVGSSLQAIGTTAANPLLRNAMVRVPATTD